MGMSQAQQLLDWEWDYDVKSVQCMMKYVNVFIRRLRKSVACAIMHT